MARPPSKLEDRVAGLLQLQPLAHHIGVVLGHVDRALVAEEVRRVQHIDVQRVAFDPFAAIEQPTQFAHLRRHADTERILHRVHSAHLVGDRTDAADARGDVGRFHEGTAAQECLEEARRFEDAQLHVAHSAVLEGDLDAPLAFHTRQVVDVDRLTCHGAPPPRGTAVRRH
jgi:hypothetical protein